ncbi:16626_t:CDS:2 [Dentiscutata heterogama]|uniref:16626_t:CDS:1 n=1 Tax=Dentiscutata heterogama TaxID=1316150 RepID=A0ACA9JUT0_9GLOM|nr:16626_t:CDS:2 [Dentiscutata heterogama]
MYLLQTFKRITLYNNGISYCSNNDIDFALPFNEYFDEFINGLITLSEIGNIDMFESGDFKYRSNFASKNIEDNVVESARIKNIENDMFESDNLEYRSSFTPIIENVGDNIYESDSEDELEDSPLKEIYTGQTFPTFESLEKCLKHYSTKMGFETKIVRVENENNVDPTTNKEHKSACIECDFVLNMSYRKLPNHIFVNKLVEKHNHALKDSNLLQVLLSSRKLLTHIKEEIYNRDLYNMISRFKDDTQTKNDTLTLYLSLDYSSALCISHLTKSVSDFDSRWADLMNKYLEVQDYCNRVLYLTKECWAYAFTKRNFSANTYSTQHVESINHVIKLEANSGNSLCQLQTGIELRLKDEAKYTRLQEFRNMNSTAGFPNKPDGHNIGFIEDDYEKLQILLNVALEDCRGIGIKETWEVKHIQSTTNHSQFVLLLEDALFNMKLIPLHWFSEEGLVVFDENQESSVQVVQNDEPIPTNTFQTLEKIRRQEINIRNAIKLDSKKVSYCCGLGLCKKALDIAVINGSHIVLENILQ